MTMNANFAYSLGNVLYEDRLREAATRERLYLSARFRKLPRLVQLLVSVLS
jgi:hypothetical protein